MSGLDNLRTRVNFVGGQNQQKRMNKGKVESLKRALLYSYQAATAVLPDGREFRCLINPDKLKNDYDDKIISIPFEDVCLNQPRQGTTTQGIQTIGLKAGDVIQWKDNGSYWIVYLQKLDEIAYFRAEIRRCMYEIEVNGHKYRVYVRGPVETEIDWNAKSNLVWNGLNYTLVMTITHNEETEAFFHRFTKVKFKGKNWEVQAIDNISTEGVIDVYLKEYFSNSIEDAIEEENKQNTPEIIAPNESEPRIIGDPQMYPYDTQILTIENRTGGIWLVDSNKVNIITQNSESVELMIVSGKSGKFNLSYHIDGEDDTIFPITILSL